MFIKKKGKLKNSRFFDKFSSRYGDLACTTAVNDKELSGSIQMFIRDLINGSLLQERYINFMQNDPRITVCAINHCQYEIRKLSVLDGALLVTDSVTNSPYANELHTMPEYVIVQKEIKDKIAVYTMIVYHLSSYLNGNFDIRWIEALMAKFKSFRDLRYII